MLFLMMCRPKKRKQRQDDAVSCGTMRVFFYCYRLSFARPLLRSVSDADRYVTYVWCLLVATPCPSAAAARTSGTLHQGAGAHVATWSRVLHYCSCFFVCAKSELPMLRCRYRHTRAKIGIIQRHFPSPYASRRLSRSGIFGRVTGRLCHWIQPQSP
jgi:hypothetical protein